MPIPLLIWGAVAAGSAYVAWKNREKLMEVVDKGVVSFAEAVKPIEEQAEREIDQLLNMSLDEALTTIELTVPKKDLLQWAAFKAILKERAKDSVQASALLARATEVWDEHTNSGDG